jgi:ESS family glutamate:Na+ symporter
MILVVYAFVGITIGATGKYLPMIGGGIGSTLAGLFHGFHFMFGIFYSLIFKKIQNNLEARGHRSKFVTNNYILSNITSFMFNIMIAASFIIITIETVGMYWLELLIITSVGGVLSYFFLKFVVAKLYGHSIFEYLIALYGMLTGTASTGIALLKSVDPDLKTEVAENLVAGSATAAIFGIPLILIILPLPVVGWTTNQPIYYSITLIALIGYLIILFFGFLWFSRRKTA